MGFPFDHADRDQHRRREAEEWRIEAAALVSRLKQLGVVDPTIVFPESEPRMWDLRGKIRRQVVEDGDSALIAEWDELVGRDPRGPVGGIRASLPLGEAAEVALQWAGSGVLGSLAWQAVTTVAKKLWAGDRGESRRSRALSTEEVRAVASQCVRDMALPFHEGTLRLVRCDRRTEARQVGRRKWEEVFCWDVVVVAPDAVYRLGLESSPTGPELVSFEAWPSDGARYRKVKADEP